MTDQVLGKFDVTDRVTFSGCSSVAGVPLSMSSPAFGGPRTHMILPNS